MRITLFSSWLGNIEGQGVACTSRFGPLVPPDLGRLYLQIWIACNSTSGMHDFIHMCHRMTWALTEEDFLEKGTT